MNKYGIIIEPQVGHIVNFRGNKLPHKFKIYEKHGEYVHLQQLVPYDKYSSMNRLFVHLTALDMIETK